MCVCGATSDVCDVCVDVCDPSLPRLRRLVTGDGYFDCDALSDGGRAIMSGIANATGSVSGSVTLSECVSAAAILTESENVTGPRRHWLNASVILSARERERVLS